MLLRKNKRDTVADVALTPMIDCVFLLLIFFLVATMYKKQQKDIDIILPESRSAEKLVPDDRKLVIGIDVGGRFYLEGVQTTLTGMLEHLKDVAANDPSRQIRLDIDRNTPAQSVVEVLNLCQFRGLMNVGIRTYDDYYNR